MCGICGFVEPLRGRTGVFDRSAVLKDMSDVLYHRGPDGQGSLIHEACSLGHRRLSLVDLGQGSQPMTRGPHPTDGAHTDQEGMAADLAAGGSAIVFNGEIYNFLELRTELESHGWHFTTRSDTEVLLASWQHWGADCLPKLRGMFAFAVWKPAESVLFVARDPFGIKPLYWTIDADGGLAFASEAKALFEHPRVAKVLDRGQLEHYLSFQYSVGERTFFQGVRKLAPGSVMEWRTNGEPIADGGQVPRTVANDVTDVTLPESATIRRWWEPTYQVDDSLGVPTAAQYIAAAFDDSVAHHRIADVEVGMLLSGGVDSTYVASALASKQDKVRAFTVGFAEQSQGRTYTEVNEATQTSEQIGTAHDIKVINPEEYWDVIERVQWHMDEPNADPAAVALYFVDELAAQKVKAVMSGEGADELFGGYRVYNTAVASSALSWLPKPLARIAARVTESFGIRGANYLRRVAYGPEQTFIGNADLFSEEQRNRLLVRPHAAASEPAFVGVAASEATETAPAATTVGTYAAGHEPAPAQVVAPLYRKVGALDNALKMQYVDVNTWLVGDILQKTDRMSMAHSLEARVPFLDAEVWKVARQLPPPCRVDGVRTKIALREAASNEGRLTKESFERPKLGFPVPMRVWLREDRWVAKVRAAFESPAAREFFNVDELRALIDRHQGGQADESRKIWAVYSFLVWYGVYFEGGCSVFAAQEKARASQDVC